MRSRRVRWVLPLLVTALLAVAVPRAEALVAGTGHLNDIDFDGSVPNFTFDGTFTWDDASFDVFGSDVNLGVTLPGDQSVENGVVTSLNLGDLSANFVVDLLSTSPTGAFLNLNGVTGSAVCTAPSCLNATATFIGTVDDLDQSGTGIPEDDLIYSIDGSITLDFSLKGSGPFGLNGFLLLFTPEGSNVTVSNADTFYDSRQDDILDFAAEATFASVADAGRTVFQALSAAEGTIPANFVIDPPGFDSIFIDVTTTATYTGPVEVCIVIPDTVTIPLEDLHILHRPGDGAGSPTGAFVDVTSGIKTAPNRICGTVDSLSPFVVALDTTGPTSTTTIPATTSTTVSTSSTVTTTTSVTTSTIVTTSTVETTTTSTTEPSTSTTVAPTSTSVTFTTTTSSSTSTSTSTSTTTSTTVPPACIAAPTFESILCRLDEVIALVEASDLGEPVAGNLLRSLRAARSKTVAAESRVDNGRIRGGKGKLKSAARSLNAVLFRVRSLNGGRGIPAELRAELADLVSPIQDDMLTLRASL